MQLKLQIKKIQCTDTDSYLYQAVPISVKIKIERFIEAGKKPALDQKLSNLIENCLNNADVLLFPSRKNVDRACGIFNRLTDAIAILAFVPNGIEIFGVWYEVK
jgi:hypothetical protein